MLTSFLFNPHHRYPRDDARSPLLYKTYTLLSLLTCATFSSLGDRLGRTVVRAILAGLSHFALLKPLPFFAAPLSSSPLISRQDETLPLFHHQAELHQATFG